MRPLFTSCVCDYCDGLEKLETYTGYIVYQHERLRDGRKVYVFPTLTDAAIWRSANKLQSCPIREIRSLEPITWQRSRGTLKELTLASEPFEIFFDHRYESKPGRGYLIDPDGVQAA